MERMGYAEGAAAAQIRRILKLSLLPNEQRPTQTNEWCKRDSKLEPGGIGSRGSSEGK